MSRSVHETTNDPRQCGARPSAFSPLTRGGRRTRRWEWGDKATWVVDARPQCDRSRDVEFRGRAGPVLVQVSLSACRLEIEGAGLEMVGVLPDTVGPGASDPRRRRVELIGLIEQRQPSVPATFTGLLQRSVEGQHVDRQTGRLGRRDGPWPTARTTHRPLAKDRAEQTVRFGDATAIGFGFSERWGLEASPFRSGSEFGTRSEQDLDRSGHELEEDLPRE